MASNTWQPRTSSHVWPRGSPEDEDRYVMMGRLDNLPPSKSKVIRIFLSSTFTDMSLERNALMKRTYPTLKTYCRDNYGMEFQVVDMRWGVRDEASDDHSTSDLCMKEIKNCQKVSVGPNFVVFIGQRYGTCWLPNRILSAEFESIVECLTNAGYCVDLLARWYLKDENALPPEYILQPISKMGVEQEQWKEDEHRMKELLRQGGKMAVDEDKLSDDDIEKYFVSVTEEEIKRGMLSNDNPADHCLCFIRTLVNINPEHKKAWRFVDQQSTCEEDERAKAALEKLKTKIKEKNLPSTNYHEFIQQWSDDEGMNERDHEAYLEEFCQAFETSVKKLIDKAQHMKHPTVPQDSLFAEVLEHAQQCATKCERFHGRHDIFSDVKNYIQGNDNIPCVIHGDSGFGKTSIMAKVAQQLPLWLGDEEKMGIVLRFLGTTPETSTAAALLTSLINQIIHIVGASLRNKFPRLQDNIAELRAVFLDILHSIPTDTRIVILLDSLDQLATVYGANNLNWLPMVLPTNVRLIVSTLPELVEQLIILLPDKPHCFIKVGQLDLATALEIIHGWMEKQGRQLTVSQENVVSSVLKQDARPLFVKLLFDDLVNWKSYDVDRKLPEDVQKSIHDLFNALETKHGKLLVKRALGYLSASKHGLTETEIEDLLSMDDDVLNDVFQYHLPPERRLPSVLWARIRNDISEYIVDREADDSKVLGWYHRQFVQEAYDRYFTDDNTISTNLLEYFLGTWSKGRKKPFRYTARHMQKLNISNPESEADRYLPEQPAVFNQSRGGKGVVYNRRKISELLPVIGRLHTISNMVEAFLKNYFFNYEMLMGWLANTSWSNVGSEVDKYTILNAHLMDDDTREWIRATAIIQRSLLLSIVTVHQDTTALANVLNGRILMYYNVMKHFTVFTNILDQHSPKYCSLVVPHAQLHSAGGELLYEISNHSGPVKDMAFHNNEDFLISVSRKMVSINLDQGEITFDVYPRGMLSEDKPFDFLTSSKEFVVAAVSSPPLLCVFDTEKEGNVSHVVNVADFFEGKRFIIKGIGFFEKATKGNVVFVRGEHAVAAVDPMSGELALSIVTEENKGPIVQMGVGDEVITILYEGGECAFFEVIGREAKQKGSLRVSNSRVVSCSPATNSWFGAAFADNTLKFLHVQRYVAECDDRKLAATAQTPSCLTARSAPGLVHHISTEDSETHGTYFVVSSSQHVTAYHISPEKKGGRLEQTYQLKKKCTAAQLSKGLKLLFIYYGGTVEVFVIHWTGKDAKMLMLFDAHSQPINKLITGETASDGLFMTCSDDGTVKMWNLDAAKKTSNLIPHFNRAAAPIQAIYQVGDAVLTTSYAPLEPCLMWSRLSGDITQTFEHPQDKAFVAAYLAPDGCHTMALDSVGQVLFWKVETSGQAIEINIVSLLEATVMAKQAHVRILRGTGFLVAEAEGTCHIISCLEQSKSSFNLKNTATVNDAHLCLWAAVQDIYVVGMARESPAVSVYDLAKKAGKTITLPNISGRVLQLTTINSSTEICVLCDSLVFFDVATGEVKANVTLTRPADCIRSDEVGNALLVVGKEGCLLIGPKTHAVEHEFILYKDQPDETLQCLSPDGNYFLYVTDQRFLSITRIDGTHLGTYPAHDSIHCMAISDDSCYVMIATSDRRLLFLLIVDPDVPEHAQRIKHARSNNKSMDVDKCAQLLAIIESDENVAEEDEIMLADWALDKDTLESTMSIPKTQTDAAFEQGGDNIDRVTGSVSCRLL